MRVTVWGEGFLDLRTLGDKPPPLNYTNYADEARRIYPDEVHQTIARGLRDHLGAVAEVTASGLEDPECGLGAVLLEATDVLVWWSHVKEHLLPAETVERVLTRIQKDGMGMVVLHSGAQSRIFRRLMGTSCRTGGWRQSDDWEAVWTVSPAHPIARGLPPVFVIRSEEVWSEPFDVPTPDELVLVSAFRGGEIFRSGCCYERGHGRIFYFRPGHESHPTYHQPEVMRVLANAVCWASRSAPVATPEPGPRPFSGVDPETHELTEGWFRR
ncbi:MAG: ThuA domain-containing protein [Acidimicrobiales bacterium]|nr:ThuA domain-containing protein [Acidimicrobiales bacterium]